MPPSSRTVQDILRKSVKRRSNIHGELYHQRLAIMILLRAYRMHQLDDEFRLTVAVEVAACGKFDDILYHYTSPRLATGTLFIQAKHKLKADSSDDHVPKQNRPSVKPSQHAESTITEKALLAAWDSKLPYSIPMYFLSFLEVEQHLPNDARYVLCTNASLDRKIECYFTIINPHKDNTLLFCEDIGATCYQFTVAKPLPPLIDALRDSCLAKLGKIFARIIVAGKVVTLKHTLVNAFYGLIKACLVPLKQKTSVSSVRTFKFKKDFFKAHGSTPTGKFLKAIQQEYQTLLTKGTARKRKHNICSLQQQKIKMDRRLLTSVTLDRQANVFATFDQKVSEFYAKFLLICNSFNAETLREKAIALLGQWCDAERGTVFEKLQDKVIDALRSDKHVVLDLPFVQRCFVNIELKQSVSSLRTFSEAYLRSLRLQHTEIVIDTKYLKRSSVHAFLQNSFSWGVYQYNSLLDLTISSYILDRMLSLSNYEALFVDSAKYQKGQDMTIVLEDLLSYLKTVDRPTILTVLGKHDQVTIKEIKDISKKYCQKILVVDKISGPPPKAGPFEWFFGHNPQDEAWTKLSLQENDQLIICGTVTSLSGMLDETDDVSFLLALLKLFKQSNELKAKDPKNDYEKIKKYYIHRSIVPYRKNIEGNSSRFHEYSMRSKSTVQSQVKGTLDSQNKEPDLPGMQVGTNAKVHIFLNGSGHGKTYFFAWLGWRLLTYDRSLYVVKFVANECSTDFEALEEGDIQHLNSTEIVRLLYRYINATLLLPTFKETAITRRQADRSAMLLTVCIGQIVLSKAMEKDLSTNELIALRLFREKFNQKKLVLLLDGLDELAPCHKHVVLACFARFSRLDGVRSLYLASRPYGKWFDDELRKTFNHSDLYQLELFSRENIVLSWHKFLQCNVNRYKLHCPLRKDSTPGRLCAALTAKLNDVIAVPLILYTVQTILLPLIKEHTNASPEPISFSALNSLTLNTFHLVERMVDKMIEMFYKDTSRTIYSTFQMNENYTRFDSESKEILKRHMFLAMYVIFADKDREKLLSVEEMQCAEKYMEELNEGKGKTIFVHGVVNGEPIFVHLIVAEFFAAHWFYKNRNRFKRESIFQSQVFWSRPLNQVRYFFNCLLLKQSDGCELHWAILDRSNYHVEDILHHNPAALEAQDEAGRMPIHLTPYYKALIDASSFFIKNSIDRLYGWSALDYAFVQNIFFVVEEILSCSLSAHMDTLFQQLCSNDTEVMLEQGIEYVSHLEKYVHQTGTANKLCERIAQYLISERKANIYSPSEKLFSLSMLEYCVKKDNALMLHYLLICQKSYNSYQGLGRILVQPVYETLPKLVRAATGWLQPRRSNSPNANGFIEQIFEQSLREGAYMITFYLLEHHKSFPNKIKDLPTVAVVGCAKRAVETHNVQLFRKIFHHLCVKLQIPHVEENCISNDVYDDDPFGVKRLFVVDCCLWNSKFGCEFLQYHNDNKFYNEGFLAHALNVGSVPLISYLLQKTKTNVTNALIIVVMNLLSLFVKRYKNHNRSVAAFKYLLSKTLDLHIVDQSKRNLLQTIVQDGCLCMVPCVIDKGFDPQQIDGYFLDDLFVRLSEDRMTRLFKYLQQQNYVDVFLPSLEDGDSVIGVAVRHGYSIFIKTLFMEKYNSYPEFEKENALIDLLQRMVEEYGVDHCLDQFNRWKSGHSLDGTTFENYTWDSVHSSIFKQIPIV